MQIKISMLTDKSKRYALRVLHHAIVRKVNHWPDRVEPDLEKNPEEPDYVKYFR